MKIHVLNPPFVRDFCRSARWAAKSRGRVQRHPDHLLILAGYLEKQGHEVAFIDGPVADLSPDEVIKQIAEFKPQMLILHTTTPSIYNDIAYAEKVKKVLPECITVAVGSHASALPEDTLQLAREKFSNSLSAIMVGEMEFTAAELAASPAKLTEIDGLATFEKQTYRYTPRAAGNINDLAFPAWRHIKPEDYKDAGKRFPFLTLINARGCIGRCIFCRDRESNSAGILRQRKPELVIAEMEYDLRLFPQIQEIMFETDSFTSIPDYTEEVCRLIIKAGIHKKISWSCNTRVDMNLKILPLMKEAGCRMLMTGFEFGTQEALDAVNKGTTIEQSKAFAATAHRLGFTIHGCFMIGAPGETEKSVQATIKLAKSLPCDTVQFSGLCPYPGTALYEWAKSKGYLVPKDWTEWVDQNFEQCTLLDLPDLPKSKIDHYIDKGLKEFYLRPRQMLRMLTNIKSMSDLKRKLYGLQKFWEYFHGIR